ncbi:MAG: hypothetical protein AB7F75_09260 [Planctomycetota bacterium]
MRSQRGLVLILVVGLLGLLAYLALNMASTAKTARNLSSFGLLQTHAMLLARSGVEKGRAGLYLPYQQGHPLSAPYRATPNLWGVTLPVGTASGCSIHIWDSSGRICLNDGVRAGQHEQATSPIPGGYQSNAVDHEGVFNISGWVNHRLRSILNAYGDVHRFAAQIGWPDWVRDATDPTQMEPTYNAMFTHSATDSGDRYASSPPLKDNGQPTTLPLESTGLGDRIIGARPPSGYADIEQVRALIDQWGLEQLPPSYAGTTGFFEMVSYDLCIAAWHDESFWRMTSEIGPDNDGDGTVDYPNDFTVIPPPTTSLGSMESFNLTMNFGDLWRPHPVPPINLNAASREVRAAVFQAPSNISLVSQGSENDTINLIGGFFNSIKNGRPTLGVGGPIYRNQRIRENGLLLTALPTTQSSLQRNKHLSVRDAMVSSQAYEGVAQFRGWPDSFERFAWHLRQHLLEARILEHAEPGGLYGTPPVMDGISDQWTLSLLYPHLFSLERRLPSWMGAPLALLSPLNQSRNALTQNIRCLLSVEDFVFRSHLPKVMFLPSGIFQIRSHAEVNEGTSHAARTIETTLKAFETTVLRDQHSFAQFTDSLQTSPDILIGPEPPGVAPSRTLGVVGLRDTPQDIPGGIRGADGGPVIASRFDFNFDAQGLDRWTGGAYDPIMPADPAVDSQVDLQGSSLEGANVSLFPQGNDACDLNPFGGLFLSSLGHGRTSSQRFTDSLYFRPNEFLFPTDPLPAPLLNSPGTHGNRGLVSLWVRVPSDYHLDNIKNIFHLTLWERAFVKIFTNPLQPPPSGSYESRLRPITLSLSYTEISDAAIGPLGRGFRFEVGVGNMSYNQNGYSIDPWTNLQATPFPQTESEYLVTNPQFNMMLFPYAGSLTVGGGGVPWYMVNLTTALGGVSESARSWDLFSKPVQDEPYVFRPGSWVRLICRVDTSRRTDPNSPPTSSGLSSWEKFTLSCHLGSAVLENPTSHRSPGMKNSKMVLSWGERQFQTQQVLNSSFPINSPYGNLLPLERLNSSIDNLVMQFGGFPNNTFDSRRDYNPRQLREAFIALPGQKSRRYPISATPLMEPVWVLDPSLPEGSKILEWGARIYDVPFTPEYGPVGSAWSRWPVRAPRIDLEMLDPSGNPVPSPIQTSLAVEDQGLVTKSGAWQAFSLVPSEGKRLGLRYKSRDTAGRPLSGNQENETAIYSPNRSGSSQSFYLSTDPNHYEAVGDDNDLTYIQGVNGQLDLFGFDNDIIPPGSQIHSVTIIAKVRSEPDPGETSTGTLVLGPPGSEHDGGSFSLQGNEQNDFSHTWNQNPETLSAWNVADLDNLEFGVREMNDVNELRVMKLRLIVEFSTSNDDGTVVTDIPWIQEVHWRWIPLSGIQILKWKME